MRILLAGATGKLGAFLHTALADRGHEIVTVARSGGALRYDITDPAQVAAMYQAAGELDAVVSAAGHVPYRTIAEMTPDDYLAAFHGKVAGQIELVRQGISRVAERGSFTLITGVLAREPIPTGTAASMANGAIEAFVRAAAIEIAPQRVNAISPTVFTESLDAYADFFPGMESVDLARVAQAYIRSVEGAQTGQIYAL
ncbi:short chain dehydrogenase [Actinoplanes regularis]|uniref:NADP-dependent 3-hydroxy acid dehydrogenase YdfG n=1 Tax=Actinoplanes regularis TaxID=52697 RepID=A0A238YMK2_9ACTN|nr:short chain dehydrogenase [Actinoplanes regularis]GIE85402.1 short chain dehydrogenase [Actinoplanes regularis]GLW29021.1 short chain dehydrogenase [Actinoplanes regularis]SNR72260.1 NADP-dependent 3-hydroxy acid dehydrogenase YdfG [Actinoplanes regularis]